LFPSLLSHELLVFFWIVPDGKNEDRSYPVGWSHGADDNQYIKECNMVFGV